MRTGRLGSRVSPSSSGPKGKVKPTGLPGTVLDESELAPLEREGFLTSDVQKLMSKNAINTQDTQKGACDQKRERGPWGVGRQSTLEPIAAVADVGVMRGRRHGVDGRSAPLLQQASFKAARRRLPGAVTVGVCVRAAAVHVSNVRRGELEALESRVRVNRAARTARACDVRERALCERREGRARARALAHHRHVRVRWPFVVVLSSS